jgi:hypothetical protein
MNKKELDRFEMRVLEEVKRRRQLGAYDTNAEAILFLTEWVALIVQHLNPKPKRKRKK